MISTLVFLIILGVLITVHELGHMLMAKRCGVKVEKFSLGFGPVLTSKVLGGTEYDVRLIPLGGFVKMSGDNREEAKGSPDEYLSKSVGKRALIVFFGPLFNYILGFLVFWLIFFAGYPALTTKVGGLIEGLGAKAAGIEVGDKITAIDGKKVSYWEDIQNEMRGQKKSGKVELSVLRKDKELKIEVELQKRELDDALGSKRSVQLLGVAPVMDEIVSVRHGFVESFYLGARKVWEMTSLTYKALFRMVTGRMSVKESVTGPLGIFYITSKAASVGLLAVLHLVALLSVSLAIFNLLPLPILDGGHIFFLGLEKLRRKPLSPRAEDLIARAGLALIITIAILVTYNDILRFFGDKIAAAFKR